jgi:hypothetical protein
MMNVRKDNQLGLIKTTILVLSGAFYFVFTTNGIASSETNIKAERGALSNNKFYKYYKLHLEEAKAKFKQCEEEMPPETKGRGMKAYSDEIAKDPECFAAFMVNSENILDNIERMRKMLENHETKKN